VSQPGHDDLVSIELHAILGSGLEIASSVAGFLGHRRGRPAHENEAALVSCPRAGRTAIVPLWAAEAFGDPTLECAWFFVRAPDGRVFAIEQIPD